MSLDEKLVESLCEYIRIETVNPPGDCSKAVDFLEALLRDHGFSPEKGGVSPEKESLWVNLGGEEEPGVVLIHHMDVVPAREEEWSFPPFSGEVRDGFVLGRGTLDTKGLGMAHLFGALKAISEKGKLRKKVFFVANPDEEVGGDEGAGYFVSSFGNIFGNCFGLNEGGIGVKGLFGEGDFFLLNVWEKGPVWLRLTARGRAGHGSRPTPSDPPARLIRALNRLLTREVQPEITEPVRLMLEELRKRGLTGDSLEERWRGPFRRWRR
ncbi:MAG: M20/M25/M40 family metallo-hydrolase [Deltaproteobacteria bacterium]|nr:MAG: M20/M25/M40 family metallo-hydrolase [Deltaproteobacteria bacterium]